MLKQITANMVKLPKKTEDVIQKVVHRVKRGKGTQVTLPKGPIYS